ncbi:hypothetical protein NC651_033296 [Populus alba x Populus x berolinensis]|nr:hypothetical protein NC651_033296 [Populus alba x Populus x berolinensis]
MNASNFKSKNIFCPRRSSAGVMVGIVEFLHDGGIPMSESVLSHFKFQFDLVRDGDLAISLQSTQCMLGCETSSCYMSMFSLGNVHGHRRLVQCGNQVPCHCHAF